LEGLEGGGTLLRGPAQSRPAHHRRLQRAGRSGAKVAASCRFNITTTTTAVPIASMTPAYVSLASEILKLWQTSLEADLIAHPRDVPSGAPTGAADLNALGRQPDPFGEPFAEGTFVGKLESDEAGEEGLYNVVVSRPFQTNDAVSDCPSRPERADEPLPPPSHPPFDLQLLRHPRTAYSFALATRDPHPSAEPARAPFYIHAHRLLLAVEDALSPSGEKGVAAFDKGIDAGDAEGGRKRFTFHFATAEQQIAGPSRTLVWRVSLLQKRSLMLIRPCRQRHLRSRRRSLPCHRRRR
jgi:hypothetical protein